MMISIILALLQAVHPGRTASDGCHFCRSNCSKHGVVKDERHCHGEKAPAPAPAPVPPPAPPSLSHGEKVRVDGVIDGDTVKVSSRSGHGFTVRVVGIDCPESMMNEECMNRGEMECVAGIPKAREAKKLAERLIRFKKVVLESPHGSKVLRKDMLGRTLAYIRSEKGYDFGLVMVKITACTDYSKYPHPRSAEYRDVVEWKSK